MRKKGMTLLCILTIIGFVVTGCSSIGNTNKDLFGSASIGGISDELSDYIAHFEECKELGEGINSMGELYEDNLRMFYNEDDEGGYYFIQVDYNYEYADGLLIYRVRDNAVYQKIFEAFFKEESYSGDSNIMPNPRATSEEYCKDLLKIIEKKYGEHSSYENSTDDFAFFKKYTWNKSKYDLTLNYIALDDQTYEVYVMYSSI